MLAISDKVIEYLLMGSIYSIPILGLAWVFIRNIESPQWKSRVITMGFVLSLLAPALLNGFSIKSPWQLSIPISNKIIPPFIEKLAEKLTDSSDPLSATNQGSNTFGIQIFANQELSNSGQTASATHSVTSGEIQSSYKGRSPQQAMIQSIYARLASFVWYIIASILFAPVIIGLFKIRLWNQSAEPVNPSIQAKGNEISQKILKHQKVELKWCSFIKSPSVIGWRKPVILLPKWKIFTFSKNSLRVVLAHELAHIKRHDLYRKTLSQLLTSLYWINPLAWVLRSELLKQMEFASDEIAMVYTEKSRDYAKVLGKMALAARNPQLFPAMSLGSTKTILLRMKFALKGNKSLNQSPFSIVSSWLAFFLFASMLPLAKSGIHVSIDKDLFIKDIQRAAYEDRTEALRELPLKFSVSFDSLNLKDNEWEKVHLRTRQALPLKSVLKMNLLKHESVPWNKIQALNLSIVAADIKDPHAIPGDVVRQLQNFPYLNELYLTTSHFDSSWADALSQMPRLSRVFMDRSELNPHAVDMLKKKLPGVDILPKAYSVNAIRAAVRENIKWPKKWLAIGPFPKGFKGDSLFHLLQEHEMPLDSIKWTSKFLKEFASPLFMDTVKSDGNGWIDLDSYFGNFGEGKSAWLFSQIKVSSAQNWTVHTSADWWMNWYNNGQELYNTEVGGNTSDNYSYLYHRFQLNLSPGNNLLAVKIMSGSRGWGITSLAE